jgi:hypothetical protein
MDKTSSSVACRNGRTTITVSNKRNNFRLKPINANHLLQNHPLQSFHCFRFRRHTLTSRLSFDFGKINCICTLVSRSNDVIGDDQSEDATQFGQALSSANRCRHCYSCCWFGRHSPDGSHRSALYEYTYACDSSTGVPHQHKSRRCLVTDRKHHKRERACSATGGRFTSAAQEGVLERPDGMTITKLYEGGGCMACETLSRLARLQACKDIYQDRKSTGAEVLLETDWPLTSPSCQACMTECSNRQQLCVTAFDGSAVNVQRQLHGEVGKAQEEQISNDCSITVDARRNAANNDEAR